MTRRRTILFAPTLALALAGALPAMAQVAPITAAPAGPLGLVLYQGGQAVVTDLRRVALPAGRSELRFPELLDTLDPAGLTAESGSPARIRRVSVSGEVIDQRSLLKRLVGGQVRFATQLPGDAGEKVETARVVSVDRGLVLNFGDRIEIDPPGRVLFDALPEDIGFAPQAILSVEAPAEDRQAPVTLVYPAAGLDWSAEYELALGDKDARLRGWAVLRNGTGKAITANVALVAGDVARAKTVRPMAVMARAPAAEMADSAGFAPMPEAVSAEDRYVYRLPEEVRLPADGVLREALVADVTVPVTRLYRLEGSPGAGYGAQGPGAEPERPTLLVRFRNDQASGLGKPMPAGIARLYQQTEAGARFVLGEDRIGHIPADGMVELALGRPFDVTAGRATERFQRLDDRGGFEADMAITLKNAKDSAVTVDVVERFGAQGTILTESQPHAEAGAGYAIWKVELPAKGEVVLRYGIRVQS